MNWRPYTGKINTSPCLVAGVVAVGEMLYRNVDFCTLPPGMVSGS
ncbi:hypothetical protein [Desulfonatronum sp. SC1]|nr:hypothetical protein [Desulfonatronum sp. SC1]